MSLSGSVYCRTTPQFPSQIFFCPDRQASAIRLAEVPTHIAIKVESLSFGDRLTAGHERAGTRCVVGSLNRQPVPWSRP